MDWRSFFFLISVWIWNLINSIFLHTILSLSTLILLSDYCTCIYPILLIFFSFAYRYFYLYCYGLKWYFTNLLTTYLLKRFCFTTIGTICSTRRGCELQELIVTYRGCELQELIVTYRGCELFVRADCYIQRVWITRADCYTKNK
jgi:hypothetical protein